MSVTLHTTKGNLKLEIFCESVPKTAENFLAHCAKGTYDGVKFHRVIKGFMAQTGDPTGTGKGGSSIWETPLKDEIRPALRHNVRGTVSMARTCADPSSKQKVKALSGPNCNGSQFFITFAPSAHLDGEYPVFARVIQGLDTTLTEIENIQVDKKNRPEEPLIIEKVTIHANPLAK